MSEALMPTPGQTIGPFFGYALPFASGGDLVPPGHPDAIRLHGVVRDGAGAPVPDALVEIWQAAPDGTIVQAVGSLHRDGWTFTGWGRDATDATGHYSFRTLAPGAPEGRAPFFAITVFARGLLDRLFTRAYLPGDYRPGDHLSGDHLSGDNARLDADRLLSQLPPERRRTLVADRDADGLRFDIVLQGPDETVFLTYPGQPAR